MKFRFIAAAIAITAAAGADLQAAEPAAASSMPAAEIAGRLNAMREDGASLVRAKLEIMQGGNKTVLQLQIKERRTRGSAELVYQVLWPKERAGEAVLLRKSGGRAASGAVLAGGSIRQLGAAQMREPLFNSDLTYEDVIDNFFAWDNQAIVGSETIGRASCQILESRPGKGQSSSYARVRTWVDTRRMVPLRIEKLGSSGGVVRRIETTRVADDDLNRPIPASLRITGTRGSVTEFEGSRIRHGVTFSDREFTPEGLGQME